MEQSRTIYFHLCFLFLFFINNGSGFDTRRVPLVETSSLDTLESLNSTSAMKQHLRRGRFGFGGDGDCYWSGTAPFCGGRCYPGRNEHEESLSPCGDGLCCWTGYKVLCCLSIGGGGPMYPPGPGGHYDYY